MKQVLLLCLIAFEAIFCSSHQDVLQWWKEISELKSIKCSSNATNIIGNSFNLIKSRKCREWESFGSNFIKHGKAVNGVLQGNVEISFDHKHMGRASKTCFDLHPSIEKRIDEISGTFKNGQLQGTAVIKADAGKTLIYYNAELGQTRIRDRKGELVEVSYTTQPLATSWKMVEGKYLIYQRPSKEERSLLIPLNTSQPIMAGYLHPTFNLLFQAEEVVIQRIFKNNCILHIDWVPKEGESKWDFNLHEGTKLPHFGQVEDICSHLGLSKSSSAREKYHKVIDFLSKMGSTNHGPIKVLNFLKPDDSPVEYEKVKLPFLANVTVLDQKTVKMSIWNGPAQSWTADYMAVDENGQLHGYCAFSIDDQYFNNTGYFPQFKWSIESFSGKFLHGKLNGLVLMNTWFGGRIFATFKDGVIHGPVASFGQFPLLDIESRGFRLDPMFQFDAVIDGLQFYGWFKNGQVFGQFWAAYFRTGFLHGIADQNGDITGDDIAFIYSDGETALKGRFVNKEMKAAFNVDVIEYGCNSDTGMFVAQQFTEPLSNYAFHYDPVTNVSFGGGSLLVKDPYEEKYVEVADSSIPNSGEGVFLKRDLPKWAITCFYSMFLYQMPHQLNEYTKRCFNDVEKGDDYRRECAKYSLPLDTYQAMHNLPPELDVAPFPNMGPKVNHHFLKNNSVYLEAEHPRWGLISSVTLLTDVKAGQELFTFYGYTKGPFPHDFPWYFEAKRQIDGDQKPKESKKTQVKVVSASKTIKNAHFSEL